MSLEWWSLASNSAFFILSAAALASAILVFLIAKASERDKDRKLDLYKVEAQDRIDAAKSQSSLALKEAATANERSISLEKEAAHARERAAQAELKLADISRQLEPRFIDKQKFNTAFRSSPKAQAEVLFLDGDFEARFLADSISNFLSELGWEVHLSAPITEDTPFLRPKSVILDGFPLTVLAGGQATGVSIVIRNNSMLSPPNPDQIGNIDFSPSSPVIALWTGLLRGQIGSISLSGNEALPENLIRIIVGKKSL